MSFSLPRPLPPHTHPCACCHTALPLPVCALGPGALSREACCPGHRLLAASSASGKGCERQELCLRHRAGVPWGAPAVPAPLAPLTLSPEQSPAQVGNPQS